MAAVIQRMALFWTSNSGQARGDVGKVEGSFLNLGRSMGQSSRQAGVMNQQMRALGTTLKYMVAGSVVFGTMNMVRNLAAFQKQLGLISAIGGVGPSGLNLVGKNLNDLSNQIIGASTELITPVSDVTAAVTNYLSTVQNRPRSEIIPSILAIGKAAQLSQTPVEDMTKALTTMNVAFARPVSTANIEDLAAKWTKLISIVPGGISAAPQLAGQLGNLAAGARAAAVSPGALFGLISGVMRFGITPSQSGQGLSYLLRSVATPQAPGTVKTARDKFAELGITNQSVQDQGGVQAIFKIFQAAKTAGIRGITSKTAGHALAQSTAAGGLVDEGNISGLGISGAGINVLATVFRRQHALRTAIALYAMWQSGQLGKDLQTLGDSQASHQKQMHEYAAMWQRFTDQSGLTKAGIALSGINLQISKGLSPLLAPFTKGIPALQKVMLHHPDVVQGVSTGTFALIAGLGLDKLMFGGALGGKLGRGLGKIPGLGKLGGIFGGGAAQTALRLKTAEDAAKGMAIHGLQDGSPERPFYVIVLGQLTDAQGKALLDARKKALTAAETEAKNVGNEVKVGKALWRTAGPIALPAIAAIAAGYGAQRLEGWESGLFGGSGGRSKSGKGLVILNKDIAFDPMGRKGRKGGFLRWDPFFSDWNAAGWGPHDSGGPLSKRANEIAAAKKLHTTYQNVQRLEQAFGAPGVAKILKDNNDALIASIAQGAAGFTLDLTLQQDGKTVGHKKVHMPPSTFSGGKTPGARGGKKVMKTNMQGHL